MKSTIIAMLAVAAIGTSAQEPYTVTETEYYDDCTTSSMGLGVGGGGMATVTGTITDTYCPEPCPKSKTGSTTVYTTVYDEVCPTGIQSATYTVTEPYSSGQDFGPTHVPSGFTVTTVTCPVCPGSPMVTLTTPVAPAASATGAPALSTAPPVGSAPAPAPSAPGQKIPGGTYPTGAVGSSNGTMPSPAQFTGAASRTSVGMTLCAAIAGMVGVMAFAL